MSEPNGIKMGFSKWLAMPLIAKLIKYGLDLILLLGLMSLGVMGIKTMESALTEMNPLIESGALPQCVRDLPLGIAMIMISVFMLLYIRRKK